MARYKRIVQFGVALMKTYQNSGKIFFTIMILTVALLRPQISVADILDAAEDGNLTEVRALIKAEANVNAKDRNGMTPLMFAAKQGYEKMVQELINAKAELNAQDNQGMTALIIAVKEDHLEVVKMLLAAGKGDAGAKKPDGVMKFISSLTGHSEPEPTPSAMKIDVNRKDKEGMTALSYSTSKGNLEMVQTLLDANADVNAKRLVSSGLLGWTALSLAIEENHAPIVLALLAAKADPNVIISSDDKTALMVAVETGNIELVQALLIAKADVNAKTKHGYTALSLARSNNHADIVRLLEQAGAR